jgi:multiple sugar transport system ATP-binding protein
MGRAIVREPKAFLMDEPLSNLDAKLRVEMRAEVSRMQQRLGTTTVYVTHDQTEAMTLGDRVAVMRAGMLQQVGPPRELYDNPRNLFVAGFIGSPAMNFFGGALESTTDRTRWASVPLHDETSPQARAARPRARDVIVGVRPRTSRTRSSPPRATGLRVRRRHRAHGVDGLGDLRPLRLRGRGRSSPTSSASCRTTRAPRTCPTRGGSGHAVARVDAAEHGHGGRDARGSGSTRQDPPLRRRPTAPRSTSTSGDPDGRARPTTRRR